ncbi:hypothetical protein GJA_1017 [Janthinobacterium agaricidamnosum NBRC 102515 = DSM 9628]|uniref:Uncharacterized protein n=1 Tax=Janthinobacterium agaricidamnosum NBRC 102515 = DSM 9628 TaxID=1349767 RepID=W0V322_9BURK|nr:hypothetical protein GJA_1017 [Janthinobacterium agaricidamnosum NBRC 102515 = DSM 9628]
MRKLNHDFDPLTGLMILRVCLQKENEWMLLCCFTSNRPSPLI